MLSYDSDLEKLRQTLQVTPKPKSRSAMMEREEQLKRGSKITFGLDIEEEIAEDHRSSIGAALDRAIENRMFDFLNNPPNLELHIRVWN